MENRTPYRVQVSRWQYRPAGRPRKNGFTPIQKVGTGYDLWTPEQSYQEARLPSAGSFLFPGLFAVRAAALAEFAKPGVHQVQIRTNQDRIVYIFNRRADGQVSGYGYTKQEWKERN